MEEAHAVFDRYADGDGDHVDPSAVRRDLEHWKSTAGTIKGIVDKRIAHFAAIDNSDIPRATFDDLDRAIDTVAEYIRKYTLLFTASSIAIMEPQMSGDRSAIPCSPDDRAIRARVARTPPGRRRTPGHLLASRRGDDGASFR
jgi:hypothetical protein